MTLLADAICFSEPVSDLVVNLLDAFESKSVKMISRRKSFDPAEARGLQTPRQDNMAVDPIVPNDERRETHPHLKRDSSFLREDGHWSVLLRDGQ